MTAIALYRGTIAAWWKSLHTVRFAHRREDLHHLGYCARNEVSTFQCSLNVVTLKPINRGMQLERLLRGDIGFSVSDRVVEVGTVGDMVGASVDLVGLDFEDVDARRAPLVCPYFTQKACVLATA